MMISEIESVLSNLAALKLCNRGVQSGLLESILAWERDCARASGVTTEAPSPKSAGPASAAPARCPPWERNPRLLRSSAGAVEASVRSRRSCSVLNCNSLAYRAPAPERLFAARLPEYPQGDIAETLSPQAPELGTCTNPPATPGAQRARGRSR